MSLSRKQRRFARKEESKAKQVGMIPMPERTQTATHGKLPGSDAEVELLPRLPDGARSRDVEDALNIHCHFCKLSYKDADPNLGPFFLEMSCPTCSATLEIGRAVTAINALIEIAKTGEMNSRLVAKRALKEMKIQVPE